MRSPLVHRHIAALLLGITVAAFTSIAGCSGKVTSGDGAPPPVKIEEQTDVSLIRVDQPERFPVVKAGVSLQAPSLSVTGVVSPDVNRTVPVISLATGRVVETRARLGDFVKKGQVLLRVQSPDIASAFADYRKAVADETLAAQELDRAKGLYEKGAISLKDFQVAQDASQKAEVDVETTHEHLRVLGADGDQPTGIVEIKAPVSGVITDQQVTNASGVQALAGGSPFTISDLSRVWILCDVYENDLSTVRVGEPAEIRLLAYPDKVLAGRISNIGAILDPSVRAAKVRVEVANPGGILRIGMFVTATFHGLSRTRVATVPASAILHLHDRDWIYVPAGEHKFRRVEIKAGAVLPDKTQLVLAGIEPGQEVVAAALLLQNAAEQ